jgi:hypothetical protein
MVKTAKAATIGEAHNFDCKETQEIFSWVSNTNKFSYLHSQIFTLEKKWGIINKSFNRSPPQNPPAESHSLPAADSRAGASSLHLSLPLSLSL